MTELEQELKAWLEWLRVFPYTISLKVSDDATRLIGYIDSPTPAPLFLLNRAVVVEPTMDAVMQLCMSMVIQYRCNFRS